MSQEQLAERFEASRSHLRAVAYRLLGSATEADDAVQETWLRFARADTSDVRNLGGWLTRVVSRVCFDMLRARTSRREDLAGVPQLEAPRPVVSTHETPEEEALRAEGIGRALVVVLDRLTPPQRVAFVLHDLFGFPFSEIAPVVDRSVGTTKQLASRARRQVHGAAAGAGPVHRAEHARLVETFLAAARDGDIGTLLTVLAPDVVRTADPYVVAGGTRLVRGAGAVLEETLADRERARTAGVALVDGRVGIVVAPSGRLQLVLALSIRDGRITAMEAIGDPHRLATLDLQVLEPSRPAVGA